MTEQKVNLLNFDHKQMLAFVCDMGEKPFRANQLLKWIHQQGITDFAEMTNISKSFRAVLAEVAEVKPPELALEKKSIDGTRKWLLRLTDGNCIETVFIPEDDRGTLCVSSQVGCGLNCSFCATATQGFNRNLSTAEIIGQVWYAVQALKPFSIAVTNVVMMGMGEPLLNYANVLAAMNLMMDDNAYGLSKYRVTLSTSGVLPALQQLAKDSEVALAVSLHAPTDELRNQLVPINKKYPLHELMTLCRDYFPAGSKRHITFEYVMLENINDSSAQAHQLVKLLRRYNVSAKVNLIPFNPFPQAHYKRSSSEQIDAFREILAGAGYITITRKTRGDDVDAACGQLVGEFQDRTSRSERFIRSGFIRPQTSSQERENALPNGVN